MIPQHKPQQADKKFFKDQIITTDDLMAFKDELLDEIKTIVAELHDKGGKKWLRSGEVCKQLQYFARNTSEPSHPWPPAL
ncbi:MAG: hypothetical protein U5K79_14950 [Cyclobacteriaceae bacterium]|nr:hypothetical protein [Cyclobacteriaceae bacterium]